MPSYLCGATLSARAHRVARRYASCMFTTASLLTFFAACTLLALTPGPGILYVLSRSLAGGRREGVLSSLGTFVGGLVHVVAAGLGISAVLATSAMAYQAVRWIGAAYLFYLGVRMLWTAGQDDEDAPLADAERNSVGSPFVQGIVTEVLNPKTAIFFLSFLPQFVSVRAGSVLLQFVVLGCVSVAMNTAVDLLVAVFAGSIGQRLLSSRRARVRQRRATGAVVAGMGVYVAVREA